MKIFGYEIDHTNIVIIHKKYYSYDSERASILYYRINNSLTEISKDENYIKILSFLESFEENEEICNILKIKKWCNFEVVFNHATLIFNDSTSDEYFHKNINASIKGISIPKEIIKKGFTTELTEKFINKLKDKIKTKKEINNSLIYDIYDNYNNLIKVGDIGVISYEDCTNIVKVKGHKINDNNFVCFISLIDNVEFNKRVNYDKGKYKLKSFVKINDDFKTQLAILMLKK